MKKFLRIVSVLLCLSFLPCHASAEGEDGGLNAGRITEEQAENVTAVMLDGFEGGETERKADDGTYARSSSGALEGEKCYRLEGNGKAGITLEMTRRRTTANTRSLCVCVYVDPAEGVEFSATVSFESPDGTFTGSSPVDPGEWTALFLPFGTADELRINSVGVSVSAKAGRTVRVSCLVDRVFTSLVDGLPEDLPYLASAFTATKGSLEYGVDGIVFTPSGTNAYIESSYCGYLTNGLYNAVAVRLKNDCDGKSAVLKLKLDKHNSYTEENSHPLDLLPGENVYYFPIGGFRSGTSIASFRFELAGKAEGSVTIKGIELSSYRFPAEYKGSVSAAVSGGRLIISGGLTEYPASAERICLYRLAPGFDEEEPAAMADAAPYATAAVSDGFEFILPLAENDKNNLYYKYLVRYEGENGAQTAGAAYPAASVPTTLPPYKGVNAPDDLSYLSSYMPGAVYIDADLNRLFADGGDVSFDCAGERRYISSDEISKLDAVVKRCEREGEKVVLRFVYSPFADGEKYCFIKGSALIPDVSTERGAHHYLSLLEFFAGRYKGALCAVVPCSALISDDVTAMRGLTADKAEKYAAELIKAARAALSPYGVTVLAPLPDDVDGLFLQMLGTDLKNEAPPLYIESTADKAKDVSGKAAEHGFVSVVCAGVTSPEELAYLYYGCRQNNSALCAAYLPVDGETARLFSLIDTTSGLSEMKAALKYGLPDGTNALSGVTASETRVFADRGDIRVDGLPSAVTTVFDGGPTDGWEAFDACVNVYSDTAANEAATSLSFDFGGFASGFGAYSPGIKKDYTKLYFRLFADYLPEDTDRILLRVTAFGDNGAVTGVCALNGGEAAAVELVPDPGVGRINKITFTPLGLKAGDTPRVCVLGIYTAERDSSESVTEAGTETMPEPESQRFDTAEATAAEREDRTGGDASLYITALCVIIAMFAVCGAVILILKKRSQNKSN